MQKSLVTVCCGCVKGDNDNVVLLFIRPYVFCSLNQASTIKKTKKNNKCFSTHDYTKTRDFPVSLIVLLHISLFFSSLALVGVILVKKVIFHQRLDLLFVATFPNALIKTTTLIIVFPAPNNGRKSQHPFC